MYEKGKTKLNLFLHLSLEFSSFFPGSQDKKELKKVTISWWEEAWQFVREGQ